MSCNQSNQSDGSTHVVSASNLYEAAATKSLKDRPDQQGPSVTALHKGGSENQDWNYAFKSRFATGRP